MSKQTVQKRGRLGAIQVQQKHVNRDGTSNVSGWTPGLQDVHHVHGPDAAADVAAARGITVTSFVAPGEERAVESSKGAHGPSEKWVKGDGIEHDEVPAMSEPEMKETSAEPIAAPAAVAKPQPMGVAIKFILDGGDEVSVYANALVGSGSITSADSGLLAFVGRVICKEIVAKESREQRQNGSAHTIQLTTEDTPLKIIPASSFNTRDEWEGMFDAPKELDGNKYAMSLQRTSLQNTLLSIIKSAVSNLEPQEGVEVTTFTLDDRKKPTHVFYDRLAEESEEGDALREEHVPMVDTALGQRKEVLNDTPPPPVVQQISSQPSAVEQVTPQRAHELTPTQITLKFFLNGIQKAVKVGAWIGSQAVADPNAMIVKCLASVIKMVAIKLPPPTSQNKSFFAIVKDKVSSVEYRLQQSKDGTHVLIEPKSDKGASYDWKEGLSESVQDILKPKTGVFNKSAVILSLNTMLLKIINDAASPYKPHNDIAEMTLAGELTIDESVV